MPADLIISPIVPLTGFAGGTSPRPQTAAPSDTAVTATVPVPTPVYTNPDIHIDPATNLVVMEFRNSVGAVQDQFPSPQQLAAYRQGSLTQPGSTD